jgi:proline dehydrogenase
MLRTSLLHLSRSPLARQFATQRALGRRAASRFVAGDTLEDAIAAIRRLQSAGLHSTLDHLGENVSTLEQAGQAAGHYLSIVDRLCESHLPVNISIKLSQLGLKVDRDGCLANLIRIARGMQACGGFLRIDMEDSSTVDDTLWLHARLREQGLGQVGLAIQSYLRRSEQDTRELLAAGVAIRLIKGAYDEPASVAFQRKAEVDSTFDRLTVMLLEETLARGCRPVSSDGRIPPLAAIATHDERRITFAQARARELGIPRTALEFQMLFGIRPDLQASLAGQGYPVRVYVPFGTEWYPYFMRRLAERPANVWFFLRNLARG